MKDVLTVASWLIGWTIIIAATILFAWVPLPASAHDRKAWTDPDRGAWFQSLKMPGTQTTCCNLTDCHQTEADWRDNQWWAIVAGKWTPIPPEKVIMNPKTIDGEAYVCNSNAGVPPTIYCFVPPNMDN